LKNLIESDEQLDNIKKKLDMITEEINGQKNHK